MPRIVLPSRRKSLIALAVIAISGSVWWWMRPHPPREPVHHGQRLSAWLSAFGSTNSGSEGWKRETRELRAFGPAAVPWLAYKLEHGRHPPFPTKPIVDDGEAPKREPLPFDKAPAWLRRWVPYLPSVHSVHSVHQSVMPPDKRMNTSSQRTSELGDRMNAPPRLQNEPLPLAQVSSQQ